MNKYLFFLVLLVGCSVDNERKEQTRIPEKKVVKIDTIIAKDTIPEEKESLPEVPFNDTLNTIAQLIAGSCDSGALFTKVLESESYRKFSSDFSKRWHTFDSTRISKLKGFRDKELSKVIISEKTLFYPFSGPDILYADLFFPDVERYILVGLEPVGTLPEFQLAEKDSLSNYYAKLNSSLNAILKFSFFRTESMRKDLRNTEVDGAIHLLFLFLNRTGNGIISARPMTIDTLGNKLYLPSLGKLAKARLKTKGVEIVFKDSVGKIKKLEYYSLNLIDAGLKNNIGFKTFLDSIKNFNTYLKGASYLLHKSYFSTVRNTILEKSTTIVQDDSGIAFRYFKTSNTEWEYILYGNYIKPISLFRNSYQKDLDSLYKSWGSIPLGFGIGYNFKDKNSNLMVIKRK
jgi:hypothetical protein